MRRMLSGLAVLALGTVASITMEAQACQGLNSPTNLQLSARAGGEFKEFGAGLAFGKSTGVFAGLGGHYKVNNDGDHSIGADGTLGYQITASNNKLAVCPVATLGYSSGPNSDEEKVTDIEARGEFSVGIPIISSRSKMAIIPTASLTLVYDRTRFKAAGTGADDSDSETFSNGLGVLTGGVGFVFSPSFALRPTVSIPFATPGSKASFALVASIGFGKGA